MKKRIMIWCLTIIAVIAIAIPTFNVYATYTPDAEDNLFVGAGKGYYTCDTSTNPNTLNYNENPSIYDDVMDLDDETYSGYGSGTWCFNLTLSNITVLKFYSSESSTLLKFYNTAGTEIYTKTFSQNDTTFYDVSISQAKYMKFTNAGAVGTMFAALGEGTPTPPLSPTDVQANQMNENINLSWTSSDDTDSYTVYRATVSEGPYTSIATGVTASSYNDTDVTAGMNYYYVAKAVSVQGVSGYSEETKATVYTPSENVFNGVGYDYIDCSSTSLTTMSFSGTATYDEVNDLDDTTSDTYTSAHNYCFDLTLSDISVLKLFSNSVSSEVTFYDSTGIELYSKTFGIEDINFYDINVSQAKYAIVEADGAVFTLFAALGDGIDEEPTSPEDPTELDAIGGDELITLSWTASAGSDSYNVYRSETSEGSYTAIDTEVIGTSYIDIDVTNGTTYYYIVKGVNTSGESGPSNEASATPEAGEPEPPTGERALIVITLDSGLEYEYDWSIEEVDAFISWYDTKASGTGPARYEIEKDYNQGPFVNRMNHLTFDKIITFEVMEYNE